jgi:hypothetical protein
VSTGGVSRLPDAVIIWMPFRGWRGGRFTFVASDFSRFSEGHVMLRLLGR